MGPMQSGLKFTDRIIQYVAKWAERKTKPASLSKGHVIPQIVDLYKKEAVRKYLKHWKFPFPLYQDNN